MVVVVVDVDLVTIPFPIAAAVQVVGGDDPVGAIVKNHVARAVIDRTRDKYFSDMFVAAARIMATGNDAVVLVVPAAIIVAHFLLFPAFVLAVVVAVSLVAVSVLVLALVFTVVVTIVAILARRCRAQSRGQREQCGAQNQFVHCASLFGPADVESISSRAQRADPLDPTEMSRSFSLSYVQFARNCRSAISDPPRPGSAGRGIAGQVLGAEDQGLLGFLSSLISTGVPILMVAPKRL